MLTRLRGAYMWLVWSILIRAKWTHLFMRGCTTWEVYVNRRHIYIIWEMRRCFSASLYVSWRWRLILSTSIIIKIIFQFLNFRSIGIVRSRSNFDYNSIKIRLPLDHISSPIGFRPKFNSIIVATSECIVTTISLDSNRIPTEIRLRSDRVDTP